MPATRIGEILHGRRGISTDTALRLARYFGTSAELWLNLQARYDLSKARREIGKEILKEIQPLNHEAAGAWPYRFRIASACRSATNCLTSVSSPMT
jgi:plasmid maintenance system antidote protein VapI